MKIATTLEGQVSQAHWAKFKESYRQVAAEGLPPEIHQSFLLQSKVEPTLWRIMTIWRSLEDLERYRKSAEVPKGVQVFRSVGTEPTLTIFEVSESIEK